MKASELRIGNLIFDYAGRQITIKKIDFPSEILIYFIGCEENHSEYNLNDIKPIRLTEEWLMKFGFKKKKYPNPRVWSYMYDFGFLSLRYHYFGLKNNRNYLISATECRWDNDIKYVHQLQNLYFALTGEELTIK